MKRGLCCGFITYKDDEWGQGQVDEHEVGLAPHAGVELRDVIEIVQEVLDAVHVGNDDQLHQPDEQVRPAGGVVVEKVQEVAATLQEEEENVEFRFNRDKTEIERKEQTSVVRGNPQRYPTMQMVART